MPVWTPGPTTTPKPYDVDEVLARLRALLRRAETTTDQRPAGGEPTTVPGLAGYGVATGNSTLSKTEFDLLELLMLNAGIVLEHHVIYERIWGYDFGPDSKNLAVYVGYLRRKLGHPELIRTVRGVGYTLRTS